MNMKLSNTLLISKDLLPSYNKAFTLAEVLITLTILGVVAAITIPSLINRQSEVAAKTKIKKAIANYENVAAVYMAENDANNLKASAGALAANFGDYFKVVKGDVGGFTTSDGAYWQMNADGNVTVCDTDASPKFCVKMWVGTTGIVNDKSSMYGAAPAATTGSVGSKTWTAYEFMQTY